MTDIQEKAGAKWFAGVVLGVLLLNMGNGLVLTAYAEETSTTTEATPEVEETTPPEETTLEEANTEDQNNDGEDGEDGEPTDPESAADGEDADEPGEVAGDGENGADANATSTSDGTPIDITTGDANAGSGAGTIVNVTDVDTNASSTPPASTTPPVATTTPEGGSNASTTPPVEVTPPAPTSTENPSTPENSGSGSGDLDITHELVASTTNLADGTTGENKNTDPDGGETYTGDGDVWAQDNFFFNIALVDSSLGIMVLRNPTETELDFRNRLVDFFTFSGDAEEGAEECIKFYNCNKGDDLNATSTNQALLDRQMAALCNSGSNYGGLIATGDCAASGVMSTMGNWFAFNSNLMVLLVNQVGDMNADVVLPEASFFESMRKGTVGKGSNVDVTQNATTTITGESLANSGGNFGEEGVSSGTSDADAATFNSINEVNPLSCFIVAVGGTWNGEVYQLPAGFQAQTMPFGSVICGRGGATGNVESINAVVKQDLEMVVDALSAANTGGNAGQAVMTGNAKSFLTILNVVNTVFINQDWMLGLFTVSGDWNGDLTFGARPDASPAEQTASDIVSGKKSSKKTAIKANVELTKTASATTVTSPSTVEYTITLKNNGGKLYRASLNDTLKTPVGAVVKTQHWDLGTVQAGEEIVVSYVVEFNGNLPAGTYSNEAVLTGQVQSVNGPAIKPVRAAVGLTLLAGEVLGVGDCPAYLTSYVVPGGNNDPDQVELLELFLRDGRGEKITPDGTYDAASIDAVKRFQTEYATSILAPWGVNAPTGHVYYTTRKTINELYCEGEKDFPLSPFEVQQINLYRNGVLQEPENPVGIIPSLNPWSAIEFPLLSEFNLVTPLASAAPSTASSWMSPLSSHPLFTLLYGIFNQLASGFGVERAQASY